MKKLGKYNVLAAPYTIWMIGFIIVPLFFILYYGLTDKNFNFTFDNLLSIFKPVHLKSFAESFRLSFISTVICLILSFPLALIFREKKMRKKSFIVYVFILPMWMNALLRTFAWLTLLERQGILNLILGFLHLPKIDIINTEKAIILGMVYNFLPFMILPLYNVLSKIDDDYINAAADLGANKLTTFIKIILPLSVPGIVSGITMVFVPALTTIIISDILGGGEILLIGNVIEQEFLLTFSIL
ncbi:MAG: ABC transporter permease, partial [Lachnospiraceae bacterium]|nr:ABC transporter permease [Lachnospiraceae bacterium]